MIPRVTVSNKIEFPKMARVVRKFNHPVVRDIEGAVKQEIHSLSHQLSIKAGSKIAIAVGSRGIAEIELIVKTVAFELKNLGTKPFIVPAMGSHGGATAEGQKTVLKYLGITEENIGIPIKSSMEVVKIGKTSMGIPVYLDKIAFESDGIVLVNRVKKHTDFNGKTESGLMKMLVIGLGKEAGATHIHQAGPPNLPKIIPEAAEIIIKAAPVLFGIAVVENGNHRVAKIKAILPCDFKDKEEKLLKFSNFLYPKIPFDVDVLIIDEMGKDISGGGMDSNVIGRIRIRKVEEPDKPDIFRVVVLDITDSSEGNASGVGLADFTTKRLVDKIDFKAFYTNEIASATPERGKVPIALATDKDAIKAALQSCWMVPSARARVVRIKNTMVLDTFYISEALIDEVQRLSDVVSIEKFQTMGFNLDGSIYSEW